MWTVSLRARAPPASAGAPRTGDGFTRRKANVSSSPRRTPQLPKGGKEEGEPYAEAALREAWEEVRFLPSSSSS
jgi:8-oxo-dGTP pyrophosphatase MutT (NUDIX family)